MLRYLIRRFLFNIPVLIGITMVMFIITNMAPGDPITAMLNPEQMASLGPEWVEQQKEALGLNQPTPIRYLIWLRETVTGNLGFSSADRLPVSEKIGERIGPTLTLMGMSLAIAVTLGIPLGVFAAMRHYSWMDYLISVSGLIVVSIPSFFLALVLIYLLSVKVGVLPVSGMYTLGQARSVSDSIAHLILPATVLGLAQMAPLVRYTRSSMLETINQDYVTVARAKGLTHRYVMVRHAFRTALIPVITILALNVPALLGGTIVIEQVFAWPGMGTLAIASVQGRDYNVLMAINLISATMILLSNLIADVLYAVADPRVRY